MMSDQKHNPAPWNWGFWKPISSDTFIGWEFAPISASGIHNEEEVLAACPYGQRCGDRRFAEYGVITHKSFEEVTLLIGKADRALIKAAPDLAETLADLLDWLDGQDWREDADDNEYPPIARAAAVLANARGDTP